MFDPFFFYHYFEKMIVNHLNDSLIRNILIIEQSNNNIRRKTFLSLYLLTSR